MKLKYERSKRGRINYSFTGFTTFEIGWWFNYNTNSWEKHPKAGEKSYSSHQDCRTVRAFRRKLKKAPSGVKFTLVSRWVGHNVYGEGEYVEGWSKEDVHKLRKEARLKIKVWK